ncbi:MAG: DNA adenine methylase [Alteromonadaceae bacterium]|jgi:DNA adenine methylase
MQINKSNKKTRSFLKWAGGKYSLIGTITDHLPAGDKLIEPFVGAATVFLNTDYKKYLLNDINADLINLFNELKTNPTNLIADMRELFDPKYNSKESFYELRDKFNQSTDHYERSVIFLYLNRHCYNGLCRYNLSGGYNVPFGSYVQPYFPQAELEFFTEKAQRATFTCETYSKTFQRARKGSVIYCDPPYVPLSKTASFTTYAKDGFTLDDQAKLAHLAENTAFNRHIPVLISNHSTTLTRKIYEQSSHIETVSVARTISHKGGARKPVDEIFALYDMNHK